MHPNPAFRQTDKTQSLNFARQRGFGVLTLNGFERPMLSHVPFILDETGAFAELHLVRSNPIARALKEPLPATLAVVGPDSYVSPDWYDVEDQVPTWNYVAVHLVGTLSLRPHEELRDLLERQSARFEHAIAGKPPWTMDKLTSDTETKLMRAIVPCRLEITDIQSTWKLNQNKQDHARLNAAGAVASADLGSETAELAKLMRDPPKTD